MATIITALAESDVSIYAIVFVHLCDFIMPSLHRSRINDALYEIHKDIAKPLSAAYLAKVSAYSEAHFHRVFKQVVGESVHQYVRRVRMEFAANQLMFDGEANVDEIAQKCGFSSLSSFSRAFKATFHETPGQWRQSSENHRVPLSFRLDEDKARHYQVQVQTPLPRPSVVFTQPQMMAYVRHRGYDRGIRQAWHQLLEWAEQEQRSVTTQIGLHHSNPAWVALEHCHYVACIAIDKPVRVRGQVNQLIIPGGRHAVFHLAGKYGDMLPKIGQILSQWLPQSGFKLAATPAYARYQTNHFTDPDERFELDFYLPITGY